MVERGDGGAIVNVSSISSQSALKDHVVYCELVQALCGVVAVLASLLVCTFVHVCLGLQVRRRQEWI